ncbi:glutathione peroxidase [Oleiagrimonas soli]|uniref:Glutathione peroxidase n=1 Tax=Oleiagrimonas soli TaxID=1543381 RepID=A0A099CWG0_9GAMM|nr:glutathione peroxidase [Oleiagrimonas soli]KGI78328.1 glutathione peroxidase [Oleiagrimonas soli]MBB6183177.1 glutathione peroxidase [Oleiagrimonas soli]
MNETVYAFTARDIHGRERRLDEWRGQALLIVNVASRCGFTPQYKGLEALQRQYAARGFSVLGFPCDQFGHQEPGDAEDILQFCSTNYDVSFPMFEKIEVNGAQAHPLYAWLRKEAPGVLGSTAVKWNFTKFLIDREGRPVRRYASATTPERIETDIQAQLDA